MDEDLINDIKRSGVNWSPIRDEKKYQELKKSGVPIVLKPMSGRMYWKLADEGEATTLPDRLFTSRPPPQPKPVIPQPKPRPEPKYVPPEGRPPIPELPPSREPITKTRHRPPTRYPPSKITVQDLPECEQFTENALNAAELYLRSDLRKESQVGRSVDTGHMSGEDAQYIQKLDDTMKRAEKLFDDSIKRYAHCACKIVR